MSAAGEPGHRGTVAALIQVVTQGVEHVLVDGFTRGERQRAHGLAYVAWEPDRELLDGATSCPQSGR